MLESSRLGVVYMQFPLLTAPLSWQGPMHFHYRDSKITIVIIAISILSLSTTYKPSFSSYVHMHLIYACRVHSLHCTYMSDRVFRTCSVIFGDPAAFYQRFIVSTDFLRSPDGSTTPTEHSDTQRAAAATAPSAHSSHSHGRRHQAASLLACGPARVVRTDQGTVFYQEHHEPTDAFHVRGRSPLQRVRHRDP